MKTNAHEDRKMLKLIYTLSIIPTISYANPYIVTPPNCINGKIQAVDYTENNTLLVTVSDGEKGKTLYTSRTASFPLIFSAFVNKIDVHVFTNSCYNGGGFAEIKFIQS